MKKNILWLVLDSLFLIVFNVLFFMFIYKEELDKTVWFSYGFIHFAFLLLLSTPLFVRKGKAAYIYSRSLYAVTGTYFLLELALGLVFILAFPNEYMLAVISQLILAAIFIGILIANLLANEHTADNVEKQRVEALYIRDISSRVKPMIGRSGDKAADKKVQMLYDFLQSCPQKSHPNVQYIEQDISNEIGVLDRAIKQKDLESIQSVADNIRDLVEERNRQLSLLSR